MNYPEAPKTLSQLVDLAIVDFESMMQDEKYVYAESVFHGHGRRASSHGPLHPCHACLAGAVMRGTLGTKFTDVKLPRYYSDDWRRALTALDELRRGSLFEATRVMNLAPADNRIPFAPRVSIGEEHRILEWLVRTKAKLIEMEEEGHEEESQNLEVDRCLVLSKTTDSSVRHSEEEVLSQMSL